MSASELKLLIINKIVAIEDELILEEIGRLVDVEAGFSTIYQLSEDERTGVEEGLNDVKDGRTYSAEEADKLIREWRKK